MRKNSGASLKVGIELDNLENRTVVAVRLSDRDVIRARIAIQTHDFDVFGMCTIRMIRANHGDVSLFGVLYIGASPDGGKERQAHSRKNTTLPFALGRTDWRGFSPDQSASPAA